MRKIVIAVAVGAAALLGGTAANADNSVKAKSAIEATGHSTDFSAHRRYRHHGYLHHRYRSYGYYAPRRVYYAPRAYYAPAPYYGGGYGYGGPSISFGFGGFGGHHHHHW